jgi:hypothetical protein
VNVSNAYDDAIISYSAYFRVVFSFIYSFIHSFTLFGSGSCVGGDWDTAIDHFKSIITHLYNLLVFQLHIYITVPHRKS